MKSSEIWLVARELGGWAEAGGVKDVVRDQAEAFAQIGWSCRVALPLYGFLRERVVSAGTRLWAGPSAHPANPVQVEVWSVADDGFEAVFFDSPSFAGKRSLYTYTKDDEQLDSRHIKGQGYDDAFAINLEFQWAVVSFWAAAPPSLVLAHDGHTGFVPAIARTHRAFGERFSATTFGLVVHNAGEGYRQEMPITPENECSLGLEPDEANQSILAGCFDPVVSATRHARLVTVSENYAAELKTGRNDHWSGPFGPWLRAAGASLDGITNGLSTVDKDPRDPAAAHLPAAFDPSKGDWAGKNECRRALERELPRLAGAVSGGLADWSGVLYVMQGRLTAQKGIDELADLVERAFDEGSDASFLVMGQGERRYEERLHALAQDGRNTGRFVFVNTFDDDVARLVFAAGDFFLMPSVYEPCGLTDLKAQLMGTLPIVHHVGGLVKVLDGVTGFGYGSEGLWSAFERSLRVWREEPEAVDQLRRRAFERVFSDFSWPKILVERYLPWLTGTRPVPILSRTAPT